MEAIRRLIYFEKQESGSMLCAQHALNTLLQGPYFSAADLASLATSLDALEAEYRADDTQPTQSVNMDDTGFFSVQVVDKALHVWGLSLVRWKSEELAAYHEDPDSQTAFILNLEQHWFTIRRFGSRQGHGHWFNCNSFFKAPELVSQTYLGMVLHSAEQEGYSVFSVRPLDPTSTAQVPASEADEVASTIPPSEIRYASSSSVSSNFKPNPSSSSVSNPQTTMPGGAQDWEADEDIELQRALQASLMDLDSSTSVLASGGGEIPPALAAVDRPSSTAASSSAFARPTSAFAESARRGFMFDDDDGGDDEVSASAAKGKALLERAKEEERRAFSMMDAEEGSIGGEDEERRVGNRRTRREKRRAGDEEEEEMMRRAMEESLKYASESGASGQHKSGAVVEPDDDDFDPDLLDDDELVVPARSASGTASGREQPTLHPGYAGANRVMDDEDAELQRALQASLGDLPPGFQIPATPPRRELVHTTKASTVSGSEKAGTTKDEDDEDEDDEDEDDEEEEPEPVLSPDEIRRRRLARFGGS